MVQRVHLQGVYIHLPGTVIHLPSVYMYLPGSGIHLPGVFIHLPRGSIHLPGVVIHLPGDVIHLVGTDIISHILEFILGTTGSSSRYWHLSSRYSFICHSSSRF